MKGLKKKESTREIGDIFVVEFEEGFGNILELIKFKEESCIYRDIRSDKEVELSVYAIKKITPVKDKSEARRLIVQKSLKYKEFDIDIEDEDGDYVTENPIGGLDDPNAMTLEQSILIQQSADEIVALIPEATRHLYPDDNKQAALKFYMEHKELF